MLWVCIVLQVLSVLAGASLGQHPAFRWYPGWTRRNGGALRSSFSTFEGDRDSDAVEPVYFRLEKLYSEAKDKDCVKCMVPLLRSSKDPNLCSCLPCTFKIIPGHANLPRAIADNLHRLKCDYPCNDNCRRSDTTKYLDMIKMLMRSAEWEIDKPIAEAEIVKEEFKPLGSGRRTNEKSGRLASHCPNGICEDMVPPRFRQSHSRKANKAFGETVPKNYAAGMRSGADTRYEPFVMDDKSRAGMGIYNMPYPKPSFHLPPMRTPAPYRGREEEIKFPLQTRRSESQSGEKRSHIEIDNRSRKEILGEGLKTSKAETLREEEEKEEKPENRNIALAIAVAPETTVVVPAWQSTSTDSEEYPKIVVKQPQKIPGESMIKKAETFPDDESEEAVEIKEFSGRESPMNQKRYPIQEEESTTVEAYPTTTENTSSEETEPFTVNTTAPSTEGSGGDDTKESWESEDNHHRSDNGETPSVSKEDDVVIGYRRDDGSTTAEPEKKTKAGKDRSRPKIVIEIADAKNSSKPGMDGVINMKVDIYSRGDLGNVYRFLSKLIPPKFRSEEANEKVGNSVQLRFRPLVDNYSDEYA